VPAGAIGGRREVGVVEAAQPGARRERRRARLVERRAAGERPGLEALPQQPPARRRRGARRPPAEAEADGVDVHRLRPGVADAQVPGGAIRARLDRERDAQRPARDLAGAGRGLEQRGLLGARGGGADARQHADGLEDTARRIAKRGRRPAGCGHSAAR
jgi:hypothetical protein